MYDFFWALQDGSSPVDKLKDDNLCGERKFFKETQHV